MGTGRFGGKCGSLIALILGLVLGWPTVGLGCNCGSNCQCGSQCSCGQWQPPPPPLSGAARVRKNQSTLTAKERRDFVAALKALKNKFHDGSNVSIYDEYVTAHMALQFDMHRGPAFFPWHRALLRNLELELQAINPRVTIPYWDFTVDNTPDSALWADDFMGGDGDPNDGDAVKTGPFARGQWTLLYDGPDLRRQFGLYADSLPTADQVEGGLTIPTYDSYPFDTGSVLADSYRNYMVGWNWPSGDTEMHNRVHAWVGGSMLEMTSPNDPIFWLVHAYFDLQWVRWQELYGFDYPEEGAPDGQNLYDVMAPFGITPADVLDHTALGYKYDIERHSGSHTRQDK